MEAIILQKSTYEKWYFKILQKTLNLFVSVFQTWELRTLRKRSFQKKNSPNFFVSKIFWMGWLNTLTKLCINCRYRRIVLIFSTVLSFFVTNLFQDFFLCLFHWYFNFFTFFFVCFQYSMFIQSSYIHFFNNTFNNIVLFRNVHS